MSDVLFIREGIQSYIDLKRRDTAVNLNDFVSRQDITRLSTGALVTMFLRTRFYHREMSIIHDLFIKVWEEIASRGSDPYTLFKTLDLRYLFKIDS